jgi:nanoRNase/pAp phosphatase (c-di-AMP/oligoRNAs hydrolase)
VKLFSKGYDKSIVESFRANYERKEDEIKRYLEKCDKYELTLDENKILLIFAAKEVNEISILYPDHDYYFIVSDPYKISVRSSENDITEGLMSLEGLDFVESVGCHKLAGGINIRKSIEDSDELFDVYQKIIEGVMMKIGETK